MKIIFSLLEINKLLIGLLVCTTYFSSFGQKQADLNIYEYFASLGIENQGYNENLPIVLEFWATWCGPCRVSLDKSNELINKYPGKANFISVSTQSKEKIEAYFNTKNLNHISIIDSSETLHKLFNVESIPRVVAYNSDRKMVYDDHGFKFNENKFLELIKHETTENSLFNENEGNPVDTVFCVLRSDFTKKSVGINFQHPIMMAIEEAKSKNIQEIIILNEIGIYMSDSLINNIISFIRSNYSDFSPTKSFYSGDVYEMIYDPNILNKHIEKEKGSFSGAIENEIVATGVSVKEFAQCLTSEYRVPVFNVLPSNRFSIKGIPRNNLTQAINRLERNYGIYMQKIEYIGDAIILDSNKNKYSFNK